MIDLTQLVEVVIALVCALISAFVIPWIKSKTDYNKLNKTLEYVKIFVEAAEQLFEASDGEAKKQYVIDKLLEKGYNVDLVEINSAIESAVLKLHNELKE